MSDPRTLRARVVPEATRLDQAAAEPLADPAAVYSERELQQIGGADRALEILAQARRAAIRTDQSAHIYDWMELADRLLDLGDSDTFPWARLDPEQRVSLVAARRHLQLAEVSATERVLRQVMYASRKSGPVRLSDLSGVSRRTVPGWVTEGGSRLATGASDVPPY
ncbi:hypothetical protein ABZS96_25860 [Streptomyces avermitilis]|uniref:hypothetical protein n=1 Tax=Streptomyces avermitilis TaxID=33903 RepID=UPI0033AACFC5